MTDIQQILFKKNDENQTTGYPITKGECIEDLDGNSDFKQVKDDTNKLKDDLFDETNRAINRENEIEELFTMPTQEAVNTWLDEHPEATTTVQDYSLTIDKMVVGTLGYVTPEMFGAVGDGQTDDTDCLQKCFDEKKDVYLENKTYLVSKKLYIYENTHIHGNGANIKASGDLLTVESNKPTSIVHIKGNNVTIDDLVIDGSLTYFNRVDLTNDEFIEEHNRYYEAKKYGSKGIFADSCKNLKIRNVLIHHTTYGFNFYFCSNMIMERCVTRNTLVDSFGLYSGIKNATIINCASYDSGDDAFPVYSGKLSVDNETGLNYQSENIKFINCYSENCHARAFLNHGGLNVVFDSCVSKNARQFCAVLGEEFYPSSYNGHKVDNTTFINCFADVNKFRGFDPFYGIQLYDFGKLCFINCIFDSSLFEESDTGAMLTIQKRGNLTFNGCDIRYFRFNTGHDVTDNKLLLKIKDCKFHGAKYNHLLQNCVFEITDSYFRDSGRYIFDVSGSYGIKFNNCDFDITKLIAGNVNAECHVECDNINIVHSGTVLSQSGRITLKGVQVVETMLQNRLKFDDKSCVIYNKTIKTYNATNAEWE